MNTEHELRPEESEHKIGCAHRTGQNKYLADNKEALQKRAQGTSGEQKEKEASGTVREETIEILVSSSNNLIE